MGLRRLAYRAMLVFTTLMLTGCHEVVNHITHGGLQAPQALLKSVSLQYMGSTGYATVEGHLQPTVAATFFTGSQPDQVIVEKIQPDVTHGIIYQPVSVTQVPDPCQPGAPLTPGGCNYEYHVLLKHDATSETYRVGMKFDTNAGVANTPRETVDFVTIPSTLAAGYHDACGLSSEGQLVCWGNNTFYQLGNGDQIASDVPTHPDLGNIPKGMVFLHIAASDINTCAIATNHQAYCWGDNEYGELGNRHSLYSDGASTPANVELPTKAKVTQIAVGTKNACAVVKRGKLYCWGDNRSGQLGIGNKTLKQTVQPIPVTTLGAVSLISMGQSSNCALSHGQAYCWGEDQNGQLGNGHTQPDIDTPTAIKLGTSHGIPNGTKLINMAIGYNSACAISHQGKAYCWGANTSGQLGSDYVKQGNFYSSVPVAIATGTTNGIPSDTRLVQVAVAESSACALSQSGNAYCWGNNYRGQLGNDGHGAFHNTPVQVSMPMVDQHGTETPVKFLQIAGESKSFCAAANNHHIYCWGDNAGGQLGNGHHNHEQLTPTAVKDFELN